MKSVDLNGLPDPVADAIEHLVEVLRGQFSIAQKPQAGKGLPIWEGKVIGKLTRDEIYEDVGRMGPEGAPRE